MSLRETARKSFLAGDPPGVTWEKMRQELLSVRVRPRRKVTLQDALEFASAWEQRTSPEIECWDCGQLTPNRWPFMCRRCAGNHYR